MAGTEIQPFMSSHTIERWMYPFSEALGQSDPLSFLLLDSNVTKFNQRITFFEYNKSVFPTPTFKTYNS